MRKITLRKVLLAMATVGVIANPAYAETTWEKLDHGADVVVECASDVHQFCADTKPGDGRIKSCMAAHLADLSGACLKALAEPEPAVFSDGANAKSMRIENSHLMRFIEMYLAGIDPDTGDIIAECYGTYANPDIPADKDSAPQAQVETIDMEQVKKEYGVLGVSMNGPKLWLPDWFEVEVGKVRKFGDMVAPWTAQLNLGKKLNVNKVTPYKSFTIARKSAVNWNKGTTVMVIDDADGNTWIMKGFELGMHPQRTYEEFMAAGPAIFKQLPEGWKARIVTLEQDNHEVPENGVATIMADEFFNVYDKTGPGMSNYKP
jgi:hypothetical protein